MVLKSYYLKKKEVRLFNPSYPDLNNTGIVFNTKNTVFIDILVFNIRLKLFTEDLEYGFIFYI